MDNFSQRNYEIALTYFQKIDNKTDEVKFYIGLSHYHNKNYDASYTYLSRIESASFSTKAQWFKEQCLEFSTNELAQN